MIDIGYSEADGNALGQYYCVAVWNICRKHVFHLDELKTASGMARTSDKSIKVAKYRDEKFRLAGGLIRNANKEKNN